MSEFPGSAEAMMTEMLHAFQAVEIMRQRRCWVEQDSWEHGWRVRSAGGHRTKFSAEDPVEAILAYDKAEREAGR